MVYDVGEECLRIQVLCFPFLVLLVVHDDEDRTVESAAIRERKMV